MASQPHTLGPPAPTHGQGLPLLGVPQGTWRPSLRRPNSPAGAEECERAVIDFVAFQDMSSKRLVRLWQALVGPAAWGPVAPREGRAELQLRLWRQLTEMRDARPGTLGVRLLQALREARLPGLERSVRTRFWAH